jgi:hypothetical protein
MIKYCTLLLLVCVCINTNAQTDKEKITSTLHTFFKGMLNADTALIRSTLTTTCILQTIVNKKDSTLIRNESLQAFMASVAAAQPNDFDERITIKTIANDNFLATTWVPYTFYYKGILNHSGNNNFVLVKQNNTWLINYIIDTRVPKGKK